MLNRFIFSIENFDSASLSMLTSIIHKFNQTGEYHCAIRRGKDIVGRFSIEVSEKELDVNCSCKQPTQVNIDLKTLETPATEHFENQAVNHYQINQGGYAVFHVLKGAGGYTVEIDKVGDDTKVVKVFDSKELKEDDLYAATVIRPGIYCITNEANKTKAELTVAYPELGKIPKQPQAIQVQCTKEAISPSKININPTQPLVFHFQIPSRIKIELTIPEDRPKPTPIKQPGAQAKSDKREIKIRRKLKINV